MSKLVAPHGGKGLVCCLLEGKALEDEKKKAAGLKQIEIDRRRPATRQPRNLTVNARPVAGIIDVEVNAHRHSAGAPRDDGVDVAQAGAVAAMVMDAQLSCWRSGLAFAHGLFTSGMPDAGPGRSSMGG